MNGMNPQQPGFYEFTLKRDEGEIFRAIQEGAAADAIVTKEIVAGIITHLMQLRGIGIELYREAVRHAHNVEARNFELYFRSGRLSRFLTFGLRGRKQTRIASEMSYDDTRKYIEQALVDSNQLFHEAARATMSALQEVCANRQRAREVAGQLLRMVLPNEHVESFVRHIDG